MKIIDATNTARDRAAARAGDARAIAAFERRVAAHRRSRCAPAAIARCSRFARRFDGADAAARSDARRDARRRGARRARRCGARSRQAARQHRARRRPPDPEALSTSTVAPGVVGRAARRAARARRLLRAGRPLPAALVAADDGGAGARRRRARSHRRLPAAGAGGDGGGARSRRHAAVPRRRRARDRGARLRHGRRFRAWTRSSGPATATSRRPRRIVAGDCAIDFYAGPTEIVIVAGGGRAGLDRRRPRRAGRARSRRARRSSSPGAARSPTRVATAVDRRSAGRDDRRGGRSPRTAPSIVARNADEAMALANRFAPEHLVVDRESLIKRPITAGAVFVGPYTAQAAGDYATGSNHVLPTAGAARFRGGLSAADFVRVMSVQRVTRAGLARLAPTIRAARARRRARRARRIDRGPAE